MSPSPPSDHGLGLALSGGGSRAAAFHRGTVLGLARVGLLPGIDVISTVSGGSLFGAAWMLHRARQPASPGADASFLNRMGEELARGFLMRSVRPRLLRALLPGYGLGDVLAKTFDEVFFGGEVLEALPDRPRLCVNASVLNHGQVAKFAKQGFSAPGVEAPGGGGRVVRLPRFSLSRAVVASAAFPVGLPPLQLSRRGDLGGATFSGAIAGHESLWLTDGGVLENLGVQTLLKSERFWTWDLVVSDAGTREGAWQPGPWKTVKSAAIAALSHGALDQVMSVMNNKQNRWMREHVMIALEDSGLAEALRAGGTLPAAIVELLKEHRELPKRRVLFVRVNQSLGALVKGISSWRLAELAARAGGGAPPVPPPDDHQRRLEFLEQVGVELKPALEVHARMGGDAEAKRLNGVATNFTGLSPADLDGLAAHAEWQILATHALYWDPPAAEDGQPAPPRRDRAVTTA